MEFPAILEKAIEIGYISRPQAWQIVKLAQTSSGIDQDRWGQLLTNGYIDMEHWKKLLAVCKQETTKETLAFEVDPYENLRLGGFKSGTVVGPFTIVKLLGRGGMGVVFLAEQKSPARMVALKMLTKMALKTKGALERFLREAELSAQLQHPNIVKIYSTGSVQGIPYLAMSCIEGVTLQEYLEAQEADDEQLLEFVRICAKALDYAHSQGVIHRDIKPENIMIANKRPVIMDFGIAKSMRASDKKLTRTGEVIGTPQYMSPEQAQGDRKLDGRTDIYSLGALLYHMLCKQPPFAGGNSMQILYKVVSGDFPTPCEIRADLPKAVEAIILKCMDQNRVKRYHNGRELAQDIKNYLNNAPVCALSGHEIRKVYRKMKEYRPIAILATAILVIAFLMSCWFLSGQKDKHSEWLGTLATLDKVGQKLQREDKSTQDYLEYATLLEKLGQKRQGAQKCQEGLDWAKSHKKDKEDAYLLLGKKRAQLLLLCGDYQGSYEQSQQLYPATKDPIIVLRLAQAAFLLEKNREALAALNKIKKQTEKFNPSQKIHYYFYCAAANLRKFSARISRTRCLPPIKLGEFFSDPCLENAISNLEKAKLLSPDKRLRCKIDIYLVYAFAYSGKFEQAQKLLIGKENDYDKKISNGEKLLLEEARGIISYCAGKPEKAIQHFNNCINDASGQSRYYHFRAQSYLCQKNPPLEKLIDDCMKTMALDHANLSPIDTLCETLIGHGSIKDYQIFISLINYHLLRGIGEDYPFSLNLWQPSYRHLGKKFIHRNAKELQIQSLLNIIINSQPSSCSLQTAQNMLGELWDNKMAKSMLQAKLRENEMNEKLRKIKKIMNDNEALSKRNEFFSLLDRYFEGQDNDALVELAGSKTLGLAEEILDNAKLPIRCYWTAKALVETHLPQAIKILKKDRDLTARCLSLAVLANAGLKPELDLDFIEPTAQELKSLSPEVALIFLHALAGHLNIDTCSAFFNHQNKMLQLAAARAVLYRRKNESSPLLSREMLSPQEKKALKIFAECCVVKDDRTRLYALRWLWTPEYFWPLQNILLNERYCKLYLDALNTEREEEKITALNAIGAIANLVNSDRAQPLLQKLVTAIKGKLNDKSEAVCMRALQTLIRMAYLKITLSEYDPFCALLVYSSDTQKMYSLRLLALVGAINIFSFPKDTTDTIISFYRIRLFRKHLMALDPINEPNCRYAIASLIILTRISRVCPIVMPSQHVNILLKNALCASRKELRLAAAFSMKNLSKAGSKFKLLRQRLKSENNDNVKKAIVMALANLTARFAPEQAQQLPNELPKYQKAIAAGYYAFLLQNEQEEVEERDFAPETLWGRDQKYLRDLNLILYKKCLDADKADARKFMDQLSGNIDWLLDKCEFYKYSGIAHLAKKGKQILASGKFSQQNLLVLKRLYAVTAIVYDLLWLGKAIDMDSTNGLYYFERAYRLEFLGELRAADADVAHAISLEPKRYIYRLVRTRILLKMGDYQRANQILNKIPLQYSNRTLWRLRGKIYMAQANWSKAIDAFTRQYLLAPYLSEALVFRAHCLLSLGKSEKAKRDLQKATKIYQAQKRRIDGFRGMMSIWKNYAKLYLNKNVAEYYLLNARLLLEENNSEDVKKQAVEQCQKGVNLYHTSVFIYGESPFTRTNFRRYRQLRSIRNSPFVRNLPSDIKGLNNIEH